MIDIHNHIIYKFDDGPASLDESMEMLKQAADQGVTDVFATSHFSEIIHTDTLTEYFQKLDSLREQCQRENLAVNLHSGSELFFHHFMEKSAREHPVGTLGNWGQYVLLEFPLYLEPSGIGETLFKLTMDEFIPIVAHPERYAFVREKPEKILDFIRFGALLQVNTGSILGEFGKSVQKIAFWLLENHYVHFIGSDAHKPKGRSFKMAAAAEELKYRVDHAYLSNLLRKNPEKIISKERMEPVTIPELPEQKGLLGKLKSRFRLG